MGECDQCRGKAINLRTSEQSYRSMNHSFTPQIFFEPLHCAPGTVLRLGDTARDEPDVVPPSVCGETGNKQANS